MISSKKHAKILLFASIAFCAMFANTMMHDGAFANIAADWSNAVIKKTVLTGMRRCYSTGKLPSTISLDDFSNFEEIVVDDENGYIALPSGLTEMKENVISCTGLFIGDKVEVFSDVGEYKGIFTLNNKSEYADKAIREVNIKENLLKDLGYYDVIGDTPEECMYFKYGPRSGDDNIQYTDNVCYRNGSVSVHEFGGAYVANASQVPHFKAHGNYVTVYVEKTMADGRSTSDTDLSSAAYSHDVYAYNKDKDTFFNDLKTTLSTHFSNVGELYLRQDGAASNTVGETKYQKGNSWAEHATSVFSGSDYSTKGSLELNDNEKLTYLLGALQNWFYNGVEVSKYQKCNIEDWSMAGTFKEIKYDLSEHKVSDTCGIDTAVGTSRNESDPFIYGYDDDGYFDASGSTKFSLTETIEKINDLIDNGAAPDEITEEEKEVNCQNSGAAKNLGWIICPVLSFISEQVQNLYDELIVPALQIKPELIGGENSDNPNAYQAWTIFQGFANTIFIIFFLFVIFSQVTGVGIDNYGIKKILPKLIIAAILVNLSYVICQVCVDLSNIIGNGVQSLFNNLSEGIKIKASLNGNNVGTEIGSTMISAVGIAGAAYAAYVSFALWILPLIVALIGVAISILFLFVLLAGRQAIVVLLVVISPLAFVCYLLPNTKKLFDKYVKIGETMLLLYPICGLMVAGGGYVSKLFLTLAGTGKLNLFYTLAAMLISIVPIFFIPKVVKSSFNALGSMGASISGFGARLSGRAKGAIKGSGAYKAGQERLGEARTRWRAGIGRDGQPIDMTLGQRLRRGSFTNRGIAKARAQYNKDQSARLAEGLLLDSDYMANAAIHRDVAASNEREKMYSEIFNRETDRNKVKAELGAALAGSDAERASASLNALIKKGGIDEALGELSNAGWSSMNSGVRDRVLQAMGDSGVDAMKAFSIYRNSGGTDSFKNWAKGTAADRGTAKYGSYAGYLQQKGSGAMNGYGKDEMQFVKSLQNSLASGMGAGDFGRMIGNAGINSNDAQARAEANNIIRQQIGSGAMTAENLGLSAEGVSAMSKGMSDAVVNGYNDYIANTYPGSSYAQTPGAAEAMARTAFSQQINDIRSDNTGRLLGKMDPNTRKNLGL